MILSSGVDLMTSGRSSDAGAGGVTERNASQDAPLRVAADTLLRGRRELIILHNADEYRLRITSNGKLILTK
jgi:hemin uptake protein HemP